MERNALFEKNKNNILNIGIVILALFIAFQIYKGMDDKVNSLAQQKDNELKKNEVSVEIAAFEKKIDGYKKVLVKRDLSTVAGTISEIAKKCSVKVLSIKPDTEEARADYIKTSFLLTINTPSYHALGDFISQIESYQDIYFVDELKISSAGLGRAVENTNNLDVNLKISTVSYLQR